MFLFFTIFNVTIQLFICSHSKSNKILVQVAVSMEILLNVDTVKMSIQEEMALTVGTVQFFMKIKDIVKIVHYVAQI